MKYGPDDFTINMKVRINKDKPRKVIGIAEDCLYATATWKQVGFTRDSDIVQVPYKEIKIIQVLDQTKEML